MTNNTVPPPNQLERELASHIGIVGRLQIAESRRGRGPKRKFLESNRRFSNNLPDKHRRVLDAYAAAHEVSIAAALRRAIDLLDADMQ